MIPLLTAWQLPTLSGGELASRKSPRGTWDTQETRAKYPESSQNEDSCVLVHSMIYGALIFDSNHNGRLAHSSGRRVSPLEW